MLSANKTLGAATRPMTLAWMVLFVFFALTLWAWYVVREDVESNARKQFAFRADQVVAGIRARMLAYAQVLRSGVGLFHASLEVERDEWREYVDALKIDENFPGIQAIGFSQRILPAERAAHIEAVRAQGFPDYTMRPQGERAEYTSVIYIEPFDERNRRAFGFDMFAEPVRRSAMEQARDTGLSVISGRVVLVQEGGDDDIQAGVLLYLPLYRKNSPQATVDQRRAALLGYVYSPFRMDDLMSGIRGENVDDAALEIFDGPIVAPETLLFETVKTSPGHRPVFLEQRSTLVQGRTWTLRFASRPAFESTIDRQKPLIVLATGLVISLLSFIGVSAFASSRSRALRLARDMTAALRISEERSRQILDTAHEAYVAIDTESRVVDWNKQAEATLGWTRAEAMGKDLTGLVIPEMHRVPHRAGLQHFLATGEGPVLGRRFELDALHKDGHEFPIEITISPLRVGDSFRFNAFLHDISERRRAQLEIKALNDDLAARAAQLEATNKELESFSYSVSHDLRSPLRAVDGFSRMLQEDYQGKLDAEGNRILKVIREASQKMGQLIDDLLAFSRMGRQAISAEQIEMTALARETWAELQGQGAHVQFVLRALPAAWGDRSLLKQVWVNLISNAIKFSAATDAAVIEAGGNGAGGDDEVVYYVKDNGAGFDMRYHDKLFGVFQRLHSASDFPGTGVGLAIVQRIVARHGGRVWAEGKVGSGATFYFALPPGAKNNG
ncbi:MAG: CHASE domain-containing protein [Pseudomonadota bacterium]|nr:CHASE domain-containing protein [Pseudomonadota bacterium]